MKPDFEKMEYPIRDSFTYRAYYSVFDLGDYLTDGENTVEIHLANGKAQAHITATSKQKDNE